MIYSVQGYESTAICDEAGKDHGHKSAQDFEIEVIYYAFLIPSILEWEIVIVRLSKVA